MLPKIYWKLKITIIDTLGNILKKYFIYSKNRIQKYQIVTFSSV